MPDYLQPHPDLSKIFLREEKRTSCNTSNKGLLEGFFIQHLTCAFFFSDEVSIHKIWNYKLSLFYKDYTLLFLLIFSNFTTVFIKNQLSIPLMIRTNWKKIDLLWERFHWKLKIDGGWLNWLRVSTSVWDFEESTILRCKELTKRNDVTWDICLRKFITVFR